MRKAFYMNIPLALIGGISFLHASLNLLFDRDRLKKNAEKRQESIEFATYSNAAVSWFRNLNIYNKVILIHKTGCLHFSIVFIVLSTQEAKKLSFRSYCLGRIYAVSSSFDKGRKL